MRITIPKLFNKEKYFNGNMNRQFWSYETGNIFGAIAGGGGIAAFKDDLKRIFTDATLAFSEQVQDFVAQYPDAAAATGIAVVMILAPTCRNLAKKWDAKVNKARVAGGKDEIHTALNIVDGVTTVLSVGILGYTIAEDASLITQSAATFVLGSSLLKQAKNPFFLKAGGLAIAGGGVFLTAFGVDNAWEMFTAPESIEALKVAQEFALVGTGAYVTIAGSLNYGGGVFETLDFKDQNPEADRDKLEGWAEKLTHPTQGALAKFSTKYMDKPILAFNDAANKYTLFFIPENIRQTKPFETSMWARLPWRAATAGLAVANGQPELAAACILWANGDWEIGLEDVKHRFLPKPEQPNDFEELNA